MRTSTLTKLKPFSWIKAIAMMLMACTRSGISQRQTSWSQSFGMIVSSRNFTNKPASIILLRTAKPLQFAAQNSLTSTLIWRAGGSRFQQRIMSSTPRLLKITPYVNSNSGPSTLPSISWACLLLKATMWLMTGNRARCLLYPTKTLKGQNLSKDKDSSSKNLR